MYYSRFEGAVLKKLRIVHVSNKYRTSTVSSSINAGVTNIMIQFKKWWR